MSSVLVECAQQLHRSVHDYERSLAAHVIGVWQAIGAHIERSLVGRRGITIPGFCKFSFVKDGIPCQPVFTVADKFARLYGVSSRRPLPALTVASTELSLSLVGNDVGLVREQAQGILDAILNTLGCRLRDGTASGRLRVGHIGVMTLDGKQISFIFEASAFTTVHQGAKSSQIKILFPTVESKAETSIKDHHDEIAPKNLSDGMFHISQDPNQVDEIRHRAKGHKLKKLNIQSMSASQLEKKQDRKLEILPRFLLPTQKVPVRSQLPTDIPGSRYELVARRAYEREETNLQRISKDNLMKRKEVEDRIQAAQILVLQERAVKSISQKDVIAHLENQIRAKLERKCEVACEEGYGDDTVRILPRQNPKAEEIRRESKQTLSRRLHDQITKTDLLMKERKIVERAEAAFYLQKVMEQEENECKDAIQSKQIQQYLLSTTWEKQKSHKKLQNP